MNARQNYLVSIVLIIVIFVEAHPVSVRPATTARMLARIIPYLGSPNQGPSPDCHTTDGHYPCMNQTASTALIAAAVAVVVGGGTYVLTGRTTEVHATPAPLNLVVEQPVLVEPAPVVSPAPVEAPPVAESQHPTDGDVMIDVNYTGDTQRMFGDVALSRNMTKQAVLNLLNDPNSAQFRDVGFTEFDNGAPVFCGTVNSKNALGGYGEFVPFYGTHDWATVYNGSESWGMGFRRNCVDRVRVGNVGNF